MNTEELNKLSAEILDSAITVHKEMGPGLLNLFMNYVYSKNLN